MRRPGLFLAFLLLSGALGIQTLAAEKTHKAKRRAPSASAGATRPSLPKAPAPTLTPEQASYFRTLDLDGDGEVSKAEAAGYADVVTGFDRADRSANGKLSEKEFRALIKRRELLAKREQQREQRREKQREKRQQRAAAGK